MSGHVKTAGRARAVAPAGTSTAKHTDAVMLGGTRTAKRTKFSGGVITIHVGNDEFGQETFMLHEALAKDSSPFFRGMLDKQWKENQTKMVKLPEDQPKIVAAYVDWCYTGQIASQASTSSTEPNSDDGREFSYLARLYIFGEKIQDSGFCNAIMTSFTELLDDLFRDSFPHRLPGAQTVRTIYDGTPQGSPARRFMVDLYLTYASSRGLEKSREKYLRNPEFIYDLATALMADKSWKGPITGSVFSHRKRWFKDNKMPE